MRRPASSVSHESDEGHEGDEVSEQFLTRIQGSGAGAAASG